MAQLSVYPRKAVLEQALAIAKRVAMHEQSFLIALKQQWRSDMQPALQDTYQREQAMHQQTFVDSPETLAQIESLFSPRLPRQMLKRIAQTTSKTQPKPQPQRHSAPMLSANICVNY